MANSENDCYNREHTWPANYFNDFYPMYADLFHVCPTDAWVNNKRGKFPYGVVNTTDDLFLNGGKTGISSSYTNWATDNPNHLVYEPIDSFKGDVARNYFYMSTRYQGEDASWLNWEMANGAVLTNEAVTLLLNWHHLDPVSQKEIDRNNEVYNIQGNRNPFIDYPIFADCIWGTSDCSSVGINEVFSKHHIQLYPNPANTICKVQHAPNVELISYSLQNMIGEKIKSDVVSNDEIDISSIPNGLYMLQLFTSEGAISKLLIKE